MDLDAIPPAWRQPLAPLSHRLANLAAWIADEEAAGKAIYPPRDRRLRALALTHPDKVKVVILGQDPYHGEGQATGLAFAVPRGAKIPPSLANIHKELASDCGIARPAHGDLAGWARQGVLLLNTSLSVEAGKAGSHAGRGWEDLADACLATVAARARPTVFMLWGAHAQARASRIPGLDKPWACVIRSAHPSPLSAHRGFLGSRPFSRANAFLKSHGETPIDWSELA